MQSPSNCFKYHQRLWTGHHGFSEYPANKAKSGRNTSLEDMIWILARKSALGWRDTPFLLQRRWGSSEDKTWIYERCRPQAAHRWPTGDSEETANPGDWASRGSKETDYKSINKSGRSQTGTRIHSEGHSTTCPSAIIRGLVEIEEPS